jgi:single-stranded-DNA-specific exonuclease
MLKQQFFEFKDLNDDGRGDEPNRSAFHHNPTPRELVYSPPSPTQVSRVAKVVKRLGREVGVTGDTAPELVATILVRRGYDARPDLQGIVRPDLEPLPDPARMKNFEDAAGIIAESIRRGHKIGINGDYDVDGVTAVAQTVRMLKTAGADFEWEIPDRATDGYGLSERIVEKFIQSGCKTVVLFDHGIHSHAEIATLRAHGIQVVVFDHHRPGANLPDAVVVDPAQDGCGFAEYHPCASGLAFFLNQRLAELLDLPAPDCGLAGLGTIADMVPLIGPNRTLASNALHAVRSNTNSGIRHLAAQLGIYAATITSADVAFYIAPAINAAGRLGNARMCVELLISSDEVETQRLARELVVLNKARQDTQRKQLMDNYDRLGSRRVVPPVLVSHHETHHQGVVGLTAQGLASRYTRPAFVFATHSDGTLKGSARAGSVEYDLAGMLERAKASDTEGVIVKFGGHRPAAGLAIRADGLSAFTRIISYAAKEQRDQPLSSLKVVADAKITCAQLTPKLIQNVDRLLDPYGQGFAAPTFLLEALTVLDIAEYPGGRRMLVLEQGGKKIRGFVGPEIWDGTLTPGSVVNIIAKPAAIYRNDKYHVQLSVDAFSVTSAPATPSLSSISQREGRADGDRGKLAQLKPPSVLLGRPAQEEGERPTPKYIPLRDAFIAEMKALPEAYLYPDLADLVEDPFNREVESLREVAGIEMRNHYRLTALKHHSFTVRPEQLEFVRWFLDRSDNAILQAPTGSGKTEMALIIAAAQRSRGYRTIFCAPTLEIQHQVHQRAPQMIDVESALLDGEIPPKRREKLYREMDPAFISAIPHVIRNDIERGAFSFRATDLLVIDEGHHTAGEYPYVPLVRKAHDAGARVLLLSATPGQIGAERSWDKFDSLKKLVGVDQIFPVNVVRRQPVVRPLHVDLSDDMKVAVELLSRRIASLRGEVLDYIARHGSSRLLRDAKQVLGSTTLTFPSATVVSPLLDRVRVMNNERERWDVVHALCGIIELSELYQSLSYQGKSGFLLRVIEKRLEMKFPVNAVRTQGGSSFLAPKRSLSLVYSSREVEEAYRQIALGSFVGVWNAHSLEQISGLSLSSWGGLSAKERRARFNPAVTTTMKRLTDELVALDYSDHPKERYLMSVLPQLPRNDQSIVFVRDRAHALFLAARLSRKLRESGREAVALTGTGQGIKKGLSRAQRKENLENIASGRAKIIVSTSAGNEGIDFARVQHGYAYRFSASPTEALQQWGRVGRRDGVSEMVYLCSAPEEHGKFMSILRKVADFYTMLNHERQEILDRYQTERR